MQMEQMVVARAVPVAPDETAGAVKLARMITTVIESELVAVAAASAPAAAAAPAAGAAPGIWDQGLEGVRKPPPSSAQPVGNDFLLRGDRPSSPSAERGLCFPSSPHSPLMMQDDYPLSPLMMQDD